MSIIGHQGHGLVIYNVTTYTPVVARVTFDEDISDVITICVEQTKPCSCSGEHRPHSFHLPRADVHDALLVPGSRVGMSDMYVEVRGTFVIVQLASGVQIAAPLASVDDVLRRSYLLSPSEESVDDAIERIFAEADE